MPKQSKPEGEDRPEVTEDSVKELESKVRELQEQAANLQAKAEAAKPEAPKESTPLPEDRLASQMTEDEVARAEILRDPFDSRNALKILCDPPGKKLRWISISYRELRNMRGWQPVRYDDAIGRELDRYIGAPPARMFGSAEMDAVVRRGDVVLCWIDKGIWNKRQIDREAKSNYRLTGHSSEIQQPIGQHATTTGPGIKRDSNPYSEVRKAPGFVDPASYRKQARGTHQDPQIHTKGRNMFEEASDEE